MKTMGDYNSCSSTNSSYEPSSEMLKGRNAVDISSTYKNFLENDIDFNEQHEHGFRTKRQDLFSHDLGYENSEIMHTDRRMLPPSLEIPNINENAFKHSQPQGHRQGYMDEIHPKPHTVTDSMRTEHEGMRRPPLKTFTDDFISFNHSAGWSSNAHDYYQAPDFYSGSQKVQTTLVYGREAHDDAIHGMLATDLSLTGTPSSNQKLHDGAPRPLTNEPSEEIYSKNITLSMMRSNPRFDAKWAEIHPIPHHERPHFNNYHDALLPSKSNQHGYNANDHARTTAAAIYQHQQIYNFQPPKSELSQNHPYYQHNYDPRKHGKLGNEIQRQFKPNIPIGNLVQLNLEEFSTGKNSPYPKSISVPKPLQLLIENDPESFMKGLNLPLEVAEHLKASKILKRLKFVSKQKIGPLTAEERKLKVNSYRQKKQNRIDQIKANKEKKKIAANNRAKVKGKIAKNKSKSSDSETPLTDAVASTL